MLETFMLKARYLGYEESPFMSGGIYFLKVNPLVFGGIVVSPTFPRRAKNMDEISFKYKSLKAFLQNWQIIGVQQPITRPAQTKPFYRESSK